MVIYVGLKTMKSFILVFVTLCALPAHGLYLDSVKLVDGGYEGIVISIAETVPYKECDLMLSNLETALADASSYLYNALDGKAYLRKVTVLLPNSWANCSRLVHPAGGELASRADIRITSPHLLFQDAPWTQQSQGCGRPGDFISLAYTRLVNSQPHDDELGRALVREWAKYRYGVFDEAGVPTDPIYPTCYHDEKDGNARATGCSDVFIDTNGLCDNVTQLMVAGKTDILNKLLVHSDASTSIMFAHSAKQVTKFCDYNTHNRYAPTKHNAMCNRHSVMEVIRSHKDFYTQEPMHLYNHTKASTIPSIIYKRERLTRYVFVIEKSNDMNVRESWEFLRKAVQKFILKDLFASSELGIVMVDADFSRELQPLTPLHDKDYSRNAVASKFPDFTSLQVPPKQKGSYSLKRGLETAYEMLERADRINGSAASVVVMITPGTGELNDLLDYYTIYKKGLNTRIATINYPQIARSSYLGLDALAHATGGSAYTVLERRRNQDQSYINAYFELTQALLALRDEFYQGDRSKLPVEIHRRQLLNNNTDFVSGTFVVSQNMGEPSQFVVYMSKSSRRHLKSIKVKSPSEHTYSAYDSDSVLLISYDMLAVLKVTINESGTWSYEIDGTSDNPQPIFVVVTATPKSPRQEDAPVAVRMWTNSETHLIDSTSPPLALYVEVKQGDWPVIGAEVEVRVTKSNNLSSIHFTDRFQLLDTGSGDPDLTRSDGIYSRYFTGYTSPLAGPGLYQFEVEVTGNSNTAFTLRESQRIGKVDDGMSDQLTTVNKGRCCGSAIWPQTLYPLSPFQRVLPPLSIKVSAAAMEKPLMIPPGHIADLRVQSMHFPNEQVARLTWTAPGQQGDQGIVSSYEIRYAESLKSIIDDYDNSNIWMYGQPIPLVAGDETTFTLNMTAVPELLDKQIFVGIKAIAANQMSHLSNIVRVFVPSLPKTPQPPELAYPDRNGELGPDPSIVPRLAAANGPGMILQVVLPVVAGALVLAVCLGLYCVMVVHRRKSSTKEPPQSPNTANSNNTLPMQEPEPYSGPPPNYEAEEKKLYCTLPPQDPNPAAPEISIIGGRTLSPYQSWTASQLLHEHERRHSPYGYAIQYQDCAEDALQGPPIPPPPNNNAVYASNYRNTSFLSLVDESSIYGQRMTPSTKVPPPTLPKPVMLPFNPSLQGSLSSVSSDKKKRNVTMV